MSPASAFATNRAKPVTEAYHLGTKTNSPESILYNNTFCREKKEEMAQGGGVARVIVDSRFCVPDPVDLAMVIILTSSTVTSI
ncbi:hypothetical protein F2Q70_00041529 [Brassica cretica]|uniref:Uncharacterized protein n=1 Tax=Brassica cretica TaxID=69181 RepID=A0A8S9KCW2_BRACR|nr:hypothetical protein F2Q70_00041529 [Brassica cretica]